MWGRVEVCLNMEQDGCLPYSGLVTKFKRSRGPPLTRNQIRFNNLHEHTRNRVENVVRFVKSHAMLGKKFKGNYTNLKYMLKVVGHTSARELNEFQRFEAFGNWPR